MVVGKEVQEGRAREDVRGQGVREAGGWGRGLGDWGLGEQGPRVWRAL